MTVARAACGVSLAVAVACGIGTGCAPAPDVAGAADAPPAAADTQPAGPPLFERLTPARTGVAFVNPVTERPDFNIVSYPYAYNGGGVAVGDVDGDGRVDLYFSANAAPNRLYLNRGDFRFEDVTERAGVAGPPGWKTGVAMADVDGDGRLDLFVSAVHYLTMRGRTTLYRNQGDGTFRDVTEAVGLAYEGYATQALFLDADGDGDLDLYLQSHSVTTERQIGNAAQRTVRNPRTGGRLYRNDGGRFTDVSARAGIHASNEGFGLGVVASDLDGDGCLDLYVANDFQEDDYLYRNRCDGTFEEIGGRAFGHTSRFSMGVDAADVNGDARPDLFVADMLPDREAIYKTSASYESWNVHALRLRAGYRPQYPRNTLQLNRGVLGTGTDAAPRFAEVAQLAGVHATDWSWAPLLADYDLDGRRDLFVTNGIWRRPNDLDYINYVGNEAVQARMAQRGGTADLEVARRMPQVRIPNHAFRNDGALGFTDVARAWGLADAGFSNGAAWADLDDDGALDLVVNRLGEPAALYRNRAVARTGHAWLRVELRGAGANTQGIGARLLVVPRAGGPAQLVEQSPVRGFQSSVDPRLHVGLGRDSIVDSLTVIWPDRRVQVLTNVRANRTLVLTQDSARGRYDFARGYFHRAAAAAPGEGRWADVSARHRLPWRHRENDFVDVDVQPLLPHFLSREGPALAVGDVDGDGRDDLFAGGAKWQPGALLLQQPDGTFRPRPQPAIAADSLAEDVDAALVDVDGDGDRDLVVASGGNEFVGDDEALHVRLYRNDGRGGFARDAAALPPLAVTAGCLTVGDFDGDGHPDLFVGARVVPRAYGTTPRSALLRNDGRGRFADVTDARAPGLTAAGMVTSAAWTDVDGDRRLDLVVAGEWMPVRVFRQQPDGHFADRTAEAGLAGSDGWWSRVVAADVTGDGRDDLVLGNVGLNGHLRASAERPARLYVHDFAGNGTVQQVITTHRQGASYPVAGRDDLVRLVPALRGRYPSYASFGASTATDIFGAEALGRATVREARTLASAVAVNDGRGRFALRPLPVEAQVAPVRAVHVDDVDGDGRADLLLGGNQYGVPPMYGRHDASLGLALRGRGDGTFEALDAARSGVAIAGEVRALVPLRGPAGERLVVVARTDDSLRVWRAPAARTPAVRARTVARGVGSAGSGRP